MKSGRRPGKRGLRWLLITLGAVIVGALALWRSGTLSPQDPLSGLMISTARIGTLEQTVLATGILKPRSLVAVGAQVSGRITAVHVALGDEVAAGDLIAEIDSTTQTNDLRTAEAALAQVRAQLVEKQADLQLARKVLERERTLSDQRATSVADLESAEADVKVTEAQIAALEAQVQSAQVSVETAQANLGYTRITAPMAGTVLAIVNQEGQTVNAAQSAPTLVVLGDLTTMTVRAEISEADVVQVKPGQKVRFSIIGEPDKAYESTLESIEPAPESITSDSAISSSSSSSSDTSAIYYNGIFHIANPDGHLRTYMTAEVEIILGEARDVVLVPTSAVQKGAGLARPTVSVVTASGSVEPREVETGLDDKINVEIRSGISEGERIVTGQASGTGAAASSGRMGPPPMGL
ncbi:efflux RND transporter periplasmic adaptor subunit [Roseibium aestuarii]|uniref:Efflux RND transporter periplasmic adaptor subunit n=1 Tax=Roseibium aestuarii TaxID=2600299 RepID=A0ABW4K1N7_9HYPH